MIEKKLRDKIAQLIARAEVYVDRPTGGRDERWMADGNAWVAEAINVVELAVPNPLQPYRRRLFAATLPLTAIECVYGISSLLRSLLEDIDLGLVSTLSNAIRAETFDNFLDQAVAYRDRGYKDQAGVIAGVVFEDTVRKIHADKVGGLKGQPLEDVINDLARKDVITAERVKQAKVGAHVRNRASRADWAELSMEGVDDTIKITKLLISEHLT